MSYIDDIVQMKDDFVILFYFVFVCWCMVVFNDFHLGGYTHQIRNKKKWIREKSVWSWSHSLTITDNVTNTQKIDGKRLLIK
jgi:hypothetical protein